MTVQPMNFERYLERLYIGNPDTIGWKRHHPCESSAVHKNMVYDKQSKFDSLLSDSRTSYDTLAQKRWVVNLSSRELMIYQRSVLEKGLNFAPTPKVISVNRIVASIESALSRIGEAREVEQARMKITNLLILRKAKLPATNLCPKQ